MKRVLVGIGVVLLVVFVFLAGFVYGRLSSPGITYAPGTTSETTTNDSEMTPEAGTTIDTSALSPGQRDMLNSLGVEADSITVTPAMIACAEAKVGAARLAEIQAGDSPSLTEGLLLMACYKGN